MSWPDIAILTIVLLSILVGLWRGFIKEVFALAVWIAALWLAFYFSGAVAEMLTDTVSLPSARTGLAFTGIFLAVLLVGALLTFLLGKLVESTGLSGTDRLLGSVFGALRGLALVLLMIMVAGFTPLPSDPWWQDSRSIHALLPLAEWISGFLPESVGELLEFYPSAEDLAT
jgi:membrane protein required for colicin V production